jgi:hypothetical protein
MPLQGVLAREALVAMTTREWFDCQMYPLMSLEVMVTIEALRTLITLEWSIIVGRLRGRMWRAVVHVLKTGCVAAVEVHHSLWKITNEHWWASRIVQVREDGSMMRGAWVTC